MIFFEIVLNVLVLVFFEQCSTRVRPPKPDSPEWEQEDAPGASVYTILREECRPDKLELGFMNTGQIAYTLPIFNGVFYVLPFLFYLPLFVFIGHFFKINLPEEYPNIKKKLIFVCVLSELFVGFRALIYFDMMYLTNELLHRASNILVIISEIALAIWIILMDSNVKDKNDQT